MRKSILNDAAQSKASANPFVKIIAFVCLILYMIPASDHKNRIKYKTAIIIFAIVQNSEDRFHKSFGLVFLGKVQKGKLTIGTIGYVLRRQYAISR